MDISKLSNTNNLDKLDNKDNLDNLDRQDKAETEIDNIINQSLQDTPSIEEHPYEPVNMATQQELPEDDPASVEVFNTALHQYLRVDEEIKSLMMAIKTRNEIKRNLSITLSGFLKAKQIKKVDLDGSYKGKRLEVEVKTSKPSFSREKVTEIMMNELREEQEIFEKIMTAISRTSVLREMYKIKVVEEKKAKNPSTIRRGKKQNSLADVEQLIDAD